MFSKKPKRASRDYRHQSVHTVVSSDSAKRVGAGRNSHNGQNLDFSKRAARQANSGQVGTFAPRSSTMETDEEYTRRRSRGGMPKHTTARKVSIRTAAMLLALLLGAAFIVFNVGSCVYQNTVSGKMAFDEQSGVSQALVKPKEADKPYYVLVDAVLSKGKDKGPDILLLVRIDPQENLVTAINIPSDTITKLSDGKSHGISYAKVLDGDAGLISAVAKFADVDIAHCISFDRDGFIKAVDGVGGVETYLSEELDDPTAGDIYLKAGWHTLTGEEAAEYCLAGNFTNGETDRATNQLNFMRALAKAVDKLGPIDRMTYYDSVATGVKTDYSVQDLQNFVGIVGSAPGEKVFSAMVPGSFYQENGGTSFYILKNDWTAMMEAVEKGEDPSDKSEELAGVDPKAYTVIVKNGGGVAKAADDAVARLTKAGYTAEQQGNMDTYAYNETLVVYSKDENKAAAQAICEVLGQGRPVSKGIYYEFDSDILVIVGSDWQLSRE